MTLQRLSRILQAMPVGMGAGLFGARDLRPQTNSPARRSDAQNLHDDWVKIGGDFRGAVQKHQASTAQSR